MDEMNKIGREDNGVHSLDFLIIIAKHSQMIFYASWMVMILTFLFLFCSDNFYKATARLLPPQQNMTLSAQLLDTLGGGITPGKSGDASGLGGTAASLLGLKAQGELYVAIMKGNTISNHIIKRFNLEKVYDTKYLEDARTKLRGNTKINSGKKDGLITIEVTDKDPQRAAAMADAYPEELDKILQGVAMQEAQGRLAFLEKERTLAAANLSKAEEVMRTFSEKSSVIQIDAQTRGMLQYIAELRASIDAKEIQIQVFKQQATPMNYDLIKLETELKGLKEKLRAAETQMDNCVGDVCLPASSTPRLGLEYLRLYRELKFQEALYQLFTKISELARLDMVKDVAVIQVVDKANLPERRVNKRALPAIMVGMVSFVITIMLSVAIEYLHNNFREEKRSEQLFLILTYMRQFFKKPL